MGRDNRNSKPLDAAPFNTLVKTAAEAPRRHEQQLQATLHKSITVAASGGQNSVTLDIVPDENHPQAVLPAAGANGEQLALVRASPGFRLTMASTGA